MIFIKYILSLEWIVVIFNNIVKRNDSGLSMNVFKDNSFNNYPSMFNREPSFFPHNNEDYFDVKNYFPGLNKSISGIFK
jgi:hypothetical protein